MAAGLAAAAPMRPAAFFLLLLLAPTIGAQPAEEATVVRAVAVAQTSQGLVGSVADVSISQVAGSGHLFLDTQPFTQVDLQGSARIAVRSAGAVTGVDVTRRDFFLVVRSESPLIGGPSAGGVLTVGAVAALKGWAVDPRVYMTGTINVDGSIGPVGGIPEKARAAAERGARLFLYPVGEEETVATTTQGRVLVNMTSYCRDQLGIDCRAVADVEAAVTAFTGYAFERPPLETEGAGERFAAAMRPLAERELARVEADLARADGRRANESAGGFAADVSRRLQEARTATTEGRAAFDDEHYYTAASRAFVASVSVRSVLYVFDFLQAADRVAFANGRIQEAEDAGAASRAAARNEPVQGLSQLEAVGAAQLRVGQAETQVARARDGARSNDAATALYSAALAFERVRTVHWWLDLGRAFAEGDAISPEAQREEAQAAIQEGLEMLAYASSTLESVPPASDRLSLARSLLSAAETNAAADFPAAALYGALESQVRSGLAIELAAYDAGVPAARLQTAAAAAHRAVAEARGVGVEPLLATSLAEFASDLTDASDRLAHYDLARIVSRSHDFFLPAGGEEPVPSRYVGNPWSEDQIVPALSLRDGALLFILGGLVGALAVYAVGRPGTKRPRTASPPPAAPVISVARARRAPQRVRSLRPPGRPVARRRRPSGNR